MAFSRTQTNTEFLMQTIILLIESLNKFNKMFNNEANKYFKDTLNIVSYNILQPGTHRQLCFLPTLAFWYCISH